MNPRPENHTGHTHTGTSHRVLVKKTDLNTTLNAGATYYAEMQYNVLHEYDWCQTHPGQCNMYNNASYRRYNVSGTTSFTFSAVGAAVRMTPATGAWTGATSVTIEPAPGVDGRAFVVYKVTNPSAGVWHYEYAIHNQNLDRSIQSFSVPLGNGITLSNIGFHHPENPAGFANDGTVGSTGFSNAVWTPNQTASEMSWNTETLAQNPNANAIRFGTMYNFRFDSEPAAEGRERDGRLLQDRDAHHGWDSRPISGWWWGNTHADTGRNGNAKPYSDAARTATPIANTHSDARHKSNACGPGRQSLDADAGSDRRQCWHRRIHHHGHRSQTSASSGHWAFPSRSLPVCWLIRCSSCTARRIHHGHQQQLEDDPAQMAAIVATGIAPTNNLEAAIDATLNPGAYTAVVRGNEWHLWGRLVEVYDLSQAVLAKLANISTRALSARVTTS